MKNAMRIYIPSRARANRVLTWGALPPALRKRVVVVVRADELDAYREFLPKNTVAAPNSVKGISATRQWIMDNADERWFFMLDDDFTGFNWKPNPEKWTLQRATDDQIVDGFAWVIARLREGYAHAGMFDRWRAAKPKAREEECVAQVQFLAYDLRVLRQEGVRFDRVPLAQDKDVTLQLLSRGHANVLTRRWSFNARPFRAAGGCAVYRDPAMERRVTRQLIKLWPGIMRWHPAPGYQRTAWKKALRTD